ncbi:hypothetical protein A2336_05755, partial [Candidatus Peregrinibacteria bacterium RIFOXYB2_FULL_41_88]
APVLDIDLEVDPTQREGLYKQVVAHEVQPALGCTEPGAVAYAASIVADMLTIDGERPSLDDLKQILVTVDPGTLKNAAGVAIPGVKNGKGLAIAAALGFIQGEPSKVLQSLSGVTDEGVAQAIGAKNKVKVAKSEDRDFLVKIEVEMNDGRRAEVVLQGGHTNVVSKRLNGDTFASDSSIGTKKDAVTGPKSYEEILRACKISDLIAMAGSVDEEDRAYLREGFEMNQRVMREGLGLQAAGTLRTGIDNGVFANCIAARVKMGAVAAADARMNGIPLPAMSSGGSGNQGFVAALVPYLYGKERGIDDRIIEEAVALSHLINAYAKVFTGKLAPVCGCSVAAGLGAAAAIAYMHDKSPEVIGRAIDYVAGAISGMTCDGAKGSCALKVGVSVETAIQAAIAAVYSPEYELRRQGLVGHTPEETIQNLGRFVTIGMREADEVILGAIAVNLAERFCAAASVDKLVRVSSIN